MTELESLKQEIETLKSRINTLEAQNKFYQEQLLLNRQKKFGKSSEQMHPDQLNFFDEAESIACANPIVIEPTEETIVVRNKKKKKRGTDFSSLPVEVIEYKLDDTTCPKCGSQLHVMTKEVRKELKIIPAEVKIVEHVRYIYSCRNCEKTEIEATIVKADAPKALIAKSFVSPSVMAHIMNEKYAKAVPLDRQEKDFKRNGIVLPRQNLSNWIMKGGKMLEPLVMKLKEELASRDVLHADETTLEVLREPGREASSKSYMWVYETSGNTDKHVVLYDYTQTRTGKYPEEYLKDFDGYLHTDGFVGYKRLEPKITLCGCWSHVRRGFHDALKVIAKDKQAESVENLFLKKIGEIFKLEESFADMTAEDRLACRNKKSSVKIAEFYAMIAQHQGKVLPKSKLGEGMNYAVNQKKYLVRFLENGNIELTNNRAERAVKPFVMGRKNWLFSNTPSGAKASAVIYSVIQTAILNDLKPRAYLEYIFEKIQNGTLADDEALLPWSESLPERLKANIL